MSSIPPPHPVPKRPLVAIPLAVAAGAVVFAACQPPAAAAPDCTLTLAVEWDGTTVQRIDVQAVYPEGVTPRYAVTVLGEGNATLDRTVATTPTYARVPDVGGPSTGVAVKDEWGYGCQAWADPPQMDVMDETDTEMDTPEPPAYAPPAPEPGDHRDQATPPANPAPAEVSRVLHSR